jgi:glutaredoxin 3
MYPVTIYTTRFCPYCLSAKELLRKKKVAYTEIDVTGDPDSRRAMSLRAEGRTTVPQIFIGERHVGGCDDLYDLDEAGQLDSLLVARAS